MIKTIKKRETSKGTLSEMKIGDEVISCTMKFIYDFVGDSPPKE